jgi:hypothetical protein
MLTGTKGATTMRSVSRGAYYVTLVKKRLSRFKANVPWAKRSPPSGLPWLFVLRVSLVAGLCFHIDKVNCPTK